jgi:hypothetical protein
LPEAFFENEYKLYNEELYAKYSLEGWIEQVFCGEAK